MAASSSDWNEVVAYWSRVGELGMEAALREAGCSEQRIVETVSLVNSGARFSLNKLADLTDPESGRAVVLAMLGRDISPITYVSSLDGRPWTMSISEAAALSVNLSSNNTIRGLKLGRFKVFGTVEGCTLLGNALATNSFLNNLHIEDVGMGSDGVRSLLQGLQSNKTIHEVQLASPLLDEGHSCIAKCLINNTTIKTLRLENTDISSEGAKHISSALVSNTTLKTLCLGVEFIGSEGMKTLLQPLSLDAGEDAMNSSIQKNTSLESLTLLHPGQECLEPLTHMIRTNKSLKYLALMRYRPKMYLASIGPTDWVENIFPALKENSTLLQLNFHGIDGLVGLGVSRSMMGLLRNSNTQVEDIQVYRTGLESMQGQINEERRMNKEYPSQLKGQPQVTTTSGRVVLCGYGFAGKTEISKTMKRIEQGTSDAPPLKWFWKKLMQSYPALQRSLFGRDAHKELTTRTRGFDAVVLEKQPYIKSIWDFAGQKEYHALHDYVFPDVNNSYFLYVCSCRLPPDDSDLKGGIKDRSHIKGECEFWLRFLASNYKLVAGSHGSQLPRVRFVLTKTDTLRSRRQIISIAEHVVRELKGVFKDVLNLCEVVEVVNAHSSRDVQRLLIASSENLQEILENQKEYEVCAQVRNLLERWSRRNPLKPVLSVEKFHELCREEDYRLPRDSWVMILTYLNDLGEIIFSKKSDFIVTNPSWFGIDILGSLINAIKGDNQCETEVSTWTCVISSHVERCELYHCQGFVARQHIKEHLDRSLENVDLKRSIPGEKLIDLMIHLEMCFQNHCHGVAETDSEYFMPALFDDENETTAKGKQQLEWKVEQTGPFEYLGRRLECQNRATTFLTPGFFPRLQVHLRNCIHEKGWTKNLGCEVGRNLICFADSGIEVCVEYAVDNDDFIDILVRSSGPYAKAVQFIEKNVVETVRTFCASPQGCQGVDLVESVIRPVCVRDLHLCIKRKAHSVLVSELKDRLVLDNAYKHTWSQRIDLESDTERALDLLEGKGAYERINSKAQGGLAPHILNSMAAGSSSAYDGPKFIYPTIEDVGILRTLETRLNLSKVIPLKLHLLCDHKDGSHKVEGQRGRTVRLNASSRGVHVPLAKLAITLLWAGVGAAANMVGASVAVPQADKWIENLFTVPVMPGLDGKTLHEMINRGRGSEAVSEKEMMKALEKYWKGDPYSHGLKEILKLDDGKSFWNDFELRKVVYTEADQENRIGWVCDRHYWQGYNQGILRSEPH